MTRALIRSASVAKAGKSGKVNHPAAPGEGGKWREMLAKAKSHKIVLLAKDFAGIKAGTKMYVATPQIIDRYLRAIPFGHSRTVEQMRLELAREHQCAATCPVSTAIFVRISAEAALEDLAEGKPLDQVAPFWRLLEPEAKIAQRLSVDPAWIAARRAAEQSN